KRTHRLSIAAVALVALGAGGYALYAHIALSRQTEQWERNFYRIKAQDLTILELQQKLSTADPQVPTLLSKYMAERQQMRIEYDKHVAGLYNRRLTPKEKLIMRVTRLFGECDIAAPSDYISEVNRYIGYGKKTEKFATAVKRAQDHGYVARIAQAFAAEGLPPQSLY